MLVIKCHLPLYIKFTNQQFFEQITLKTGKKFQKLASNLPSIIKESGQVKFSMLN